MHLGQSQLLSSLLLIFILLLLFSPCVFSQAAVISSGGNITMVLINATQLSSYWAGVVGRLNGSTIADLNLPVSEQNVTNNIIYYNEPNGSYASFYNTTLMLTRLSVKPDPAYIYSPVQSDFNESGMFSTFVAFSGMANYSKYIESPLMTFSPFLTTTCYIYQLPFVCPYIVLKNNTKMGVLKFDNGSVVEPLFISTIESLEGYNGTYFDFEFMVPYLENYYFYIYGQKECNITVWIDDVQTTTFPKTGVPYKVVAQVRDENQNIVENASIRAVEENGRSIFYPIIDAARKFLGYGVAKTNESGMATFVLTPSRYNIPDEYNYSIYLEVSNGFYCRQNLSIASYASLTPTYRSSLVNSNYASQVKAATQNMNALALIASKWVTQKKVREKNITVYTNGSIAHNSSIRLKSAAINVLNITVNDSNTGEVVNATLDFSENDGLIIFSPLQPEKDLYVSKKVFYSNESIVIIPTKYNNNANIKVLISYSGGTIGSYELDVDPLLKEPDSDEKDMSDSLYVALASSLQNINAVLANVGKSLSMV
ncbi:MAG: hypothetical protein QXI17_03945 [Candidatus Bilamarchaeaceae archaeon]